MLSVSLPTADTHDGWVGTGVAFLARQDLARVASGVVSLGADGTDGVGSIASGCGVAAVLASAAASAWAEGDVVLQGAFVVEEVKARASNARQVFLADDDCEDHGGQGSCLVSFREWRAIEGSGQDEFPGKGFRLRGGHLRTMLVWGHH
jgi:hypothetical protein